MKYYKNFLESSGWEARPGQENAVSLLCQLVDSDEGESLAIQAPTGTGKSVAALLAGVYSACEGKGRVVIATYSVLLTDQYSDDISEVEKAFPDVRFSVLKGASNYPCLVAARDAMNKMKAAGNMSRVRDMANELKLYKEGEGSLPIWAAANSENCGIHYSTGEKKTCNYIDARNKALAADVVVTNHAMLRCDLETRDGNQSSSEGAILGKYRTVIMDEAHKIGDSMVFSQTLSLKRLEHLMEHLDVKRSMSFRKWADLLEHFRKIKDLPKWHASENDWCYPTAAMGRSLIDVLPTGKEITDLAFDLTSSRDIPFDDKAQIETTLNLFSRIGYLCSDIADGLGTGATGLWLSAGSGYKIQDMQVSKSLVDSLSNLRVGWMSATLGTESHPTYCLDAAGIESVFIEVPTPFNYEKQMDWTVVDWSSITRRDVARWFRGVRVGGKLVLTGSHRKKEEFCDYFGSSEAGGVFMQEGAGSRAAESMERFKLWNNKNGTNAVLVGVDIFSTGLNLKKELCTGVFIDGIKGLRLDKAYVVQRKRWIEMSGGRGFEDFELPERAIALEQQVGRLIRSEDCIGSVVFYCNGKRGSVDLQIVAEAMKRFGGARYKIPADLGKE